MHILLTRALFLSTYAYEFTIVDEHFNCNLKPRKLRPKIFPGNTDLITE